MTTNFDRLNVVIGHTGAGNWASGLADALSPLPLEFHWPRTTDAVLSLVSGKPMHVAVLDETLPDVGGCGVIRMIRALGHVLPCLLVCHRPTQRMLHEAIGLNVYTVVESEYDGGRIAPLVVQAVRRVYQPNWPENRSFN